jgi:hypothetical protein
MDKVIIECEKMARFYVDKNDKTTQKDIIKMCKDFGVNYKVIE